MQLENKDLPVYAQQLTHSGYFYYLSL